MKKVFLSLFLVFICTSFAFSQGATWSYTKDFATVTGVNAICKDAAGNIWYAAKTGTAGIVIVNSNGTALSFSPVTKVGTTTITGCQGLQLDPLDGNIVAVVNSNILVRINATTGAVMANATVPGIGTNTDLSNFGIDKEGNIYFTHVTQPAPLEIWDKTFTKVKDAVAVATDAPSCMAVTVTNNADWMWSTSDGSNMKGVQVYVGKTGGGSAIWHYRAGMNYDATAKTFSFSKDSAFVSITATRKILPGRGDIESFNWDGTSINCWIGEKGGKALKLSLGSDLAGNIVFKDSITLSGQISTPRGIILQSTTGALVADYDKNRIAQFTATPIVWKNWLFVKDLMRGTSEVGAVQGVVIDKNGVIWLGMYVTWNTVSVPGKTLPSILRFNSDYTVKDTIWKLVGPGINDTLGGRSYGIALDSDGNILYIGGTASGNTLYRINYQTGAAMNRVNPGVGSLAFPASDKAGHVFVRDVVAGTPKGIMIFEKNFNDNSIPNIAVAPKDFPGGNYFITRCITVTPDGNDIFVGSTTGQSVAQFHSDNGSDGPYTFKQWVGAYPAGQVVALDPKGRLWIGTDDYSRYDCWDLSTMTLVDGISQASTTDKTLGQIVQTRGIGFSSDGKTIITCDFNTGVVQRWTNDISLQPYANVTFMVNTATVPDTIGAKSLVQIRGDDPLFGPWGDNTTKVTRVDGDYWKATVRLTKGKVIPYKFFTNGSGKNDLGWENDLLPDGNRTLTVPTSDTILPLQFVNGTPNKQLQYWTPLVKHGDSIAVMMTVNMQGNSGFDKTKQFVGVRGAFPASSPDMTAPNWSKNFVLTQQQSHGNAGQASYDGTNLWSGVTYMPKSMVGTSVEYKFVILNNPTATEGVATWEGTANRSFKLGGDTTLTWKYWENTPPVLVKGTDTISVTWSADLSAAITNKGFTPGDTIYVQFGHGGSGKDLAGNSPAQVNLAKTGITGNIYTATSKVIGKIGNPLYYNYYTTKNGTNYREVFFNFDYPSTADPTLAEKRSITAAKTVSVSDNVKSITDGRRQPNFRNVTKLKQPVTVTITCDLRPAYYSVKAGLFMNDIQGTANIGNADSVYLDGVWINGPLMGGWAGWGGNLRDSVNQKMWDDGTHGDAVAGDHIYAVKRTLTTNDIIGQEFKFGVYGGDNESAYGLNHIENLDDANATYTLATQFGSINPNRYSAWDYNAGAPKGGFTAQTSGSTDLLRPVVVISDQVVWAAGNNGTVLRTTNGGTTWVKTTAPDATYNNYTMDAIDANTAWVFATQKDVSGLGLSRIYKTTDGGTTWTKQYENTNTYGDAIAFVDANNGVAFGDQDDANAANFVIVTTTDGGTTWVRVDASKVPAIPGDFAGLSNSVAKSGNTVWFTCYGSSTPSQIYKSTDKGATWKSYPIPTIPAGALPYIDFKDANNGVAVTTAGLVTKTTDGGATWGTAVTVDAGGFRNVDYIAGTNTIIAAGGPTATGILYSSGDNGATWTKMTLPTGTPRIRGVKFFSGTLGWTVGENGVITKYSGASLVSVKQVGSAPTTYTLYQNYPNPFNPTTTINYDLPKASNVTLKIYNSLGQEVRTLVNEMQSAGSYQVNFNASNIASGLYFYRIQADGYTSIKKMMLLK